MKTMSSRLIENRKAHFNYEVLETYSVGIELLGSEVRAIRDGLGKLEGAYGAIRGKELFLLGFSIPSSQPNNPSAAHDPDRTKKLLLKKAEIADLERKLSQKGLTLVPLSLYNADRSKTKKIKVDLALVHGKKNYDKRESIKKKDAKRELDRTLKTRLK